MIDVRIKKQLKTAQGILDLELDFNLTKGSITCIYGDSGVGKTTILRFIAGLTTANQGYLCVDDQVWTDNSQRIRIPVQDRSIGMVFQDFALFPNMTVVENLRFALSKNQNPTIIEELLQIMELDQLQNQYPDQLSGGQKQRIALARAIIRKPKLLLLDEALSALDNSMRFKLQDYILKIYKKYNLTIVFVSHHIPEIFKLADTVLHIQNGKITQKGNPSEIFTTSTVSSKYKITGEIIAIKKSDIVYIVSILSQQDMIEVIATEKEALQLHIGQHVLVASKAFNPLIQAL